LRSPWPLPRLRAAHPMRRRGPAQNLRTAIECLPIETKRAMLESIDVNRIIVGAYVDRKGGVCPMLAAHRNGGRTSLASFARAWDRYTRAGRNPRPATERELRTLRVMLEASIAIEEDRGEDGLAHAIAEHRAAKERRPARDTGERDRTPELQHREGWAWLRVFRRYDAYELALQETERPEPEPELERV
jgi:hypothetical protein